MLFWGLRVASFLVARVPLAIAYAVAAVVADWVFPLVRQKHQNALDNMAQVLGPSAPPDLVQRTVRDAERNYARYLVDFLRMPYTMPAELDRRITVANEAVIGEVLARGRGAIFVGMHVGSWDLGAAWLAIRGYPVHAVVDTFKHPRLNDYIQSTRRRSGLRVIPVHHAARQGLQVLRRGEALGILIDRPMGDEGVPVEFFGWKTSLPAGAATLALKTGAPVVAMTILRNPDHTYTGIVAPVLSIEPSGERQQDVQAFTQRIVVEFEEIIRRHPDQWYMFRAMWPAPAPSPATSDPMAAAPEAAN